MNDLHSYSALRQVTQLIQNLTGLFDATTVTVDAKTILNLQWNIMRDCLDSSLSITTCLTPANTHVDTRWPCWDGTLCPAMPHSPWNVKGDALWLCNFPAARVCSRLYYGLLWEESGLFLWGIEDLIFLLHHFSSLCFCPFPFLALNSQKSFFFPPDLFSHTSAISWPEMMQKLICSRPQANRISVPLWGNVTSAVVSWE